jgi:predicted AAA+ superfamily ATPase
MSGRYVEIKMLPLSFKEYLELHPPNEKKSLDVRFSDYMQYGALPMIDPDNEDKEFIKGQIEGVYNTVLVKDVMARMTPRNSTDLEAVSKYLYSNIGNLTNALNISKHSGITSMTVKSYVKALEDAFLFYKAYRYDVKGKRILKSSEKYYASDTGIRNIALGEFSDKGRLLENIVYLELIRRGYKVRVGSYKDLEIDFTAQKWERTEYFQVTESMIFTNSAERDVHYLESIRDNFPKTILSLDRLLENPGNGIRHLNVIDWLLDDE